MLNKKTKRTLKKIITGVCAVLISVPLATLAGKNAETLAVVWDSERELAVQKGSATLAMNASALLLYKPSDIPGEIIREALPPVELNLNDDDAFNQPSAQVLSKNITDIREEPPTFNTNNGKIVKTTFKPNGGGGFINLDLGGQVRNATEISNSVMLAESRKLPEFSLELNGEPEVLILHTHTTEAFQPDKYDFFDTSYHSRSLDSSKNIVAVGAEIAKSFAEAGITVIHDGTVHDHPHFTGAYARSAETVRQILKAYPSIKVVLDVHRDAIDGKDGSRIAPVTNVGGRDAAQIMLISAADDGNWNVPEFMQNFRLASLFQQQMEHDNEGITRAVLFQYCQYNQQLSTGSLLLEVGSHANTLAEAKYAGQLVGRSMAAALLQLTV